MARSVRHAASLWTLAFVAGLVAGCFKDTGGDDAGGCAEGSKGCACYGNGTCDPELECREGSCVPVGCTAGSQDCVCVDGDCLTGLVCNLGVCLPPADETGDTGTGTATDSETTDATVGTTTDSSTDTGTTDPSTSDSSTTDPTDTMGSSSVSTDTTDTMGQACDAMGDCYTCIKCEGGKSCVQEWNACSAGDKCIDYVECALACDGDQGCWSNCKGVSPDYGLGDAAVKCACDPCAGSCAGITDLVCN